MIVKIGMAMTALLAGAGLISWYITPKPGVMLIRALFGKGSADFSAALKRHVPANILIRSNLSYDTSDPTCQLDIYSLPDLSPDAPTVVWSHGGGFVSGQRSDVANYLKILSSKGFAVVNIDYTIAPAATHPVPARQFAQALRYIDTHADALGLNRHNLVLAGDSAGAQIAAQVATLMTNPHYATALDIAAPVHPIQITGTLLYCGVFDAEHLDDSRNPLIRSFMHIMTWAYSGQRNWRNAKGFEYISVTPHVTSDFPPTFISAGNADPLAPQSHLMDKALRDKGVPVLSLFYDDEHKPALGHEYQFNLDTECGQKALTRSVNWLKKLTKNS